MCHEHREVIGGTVFEMGVWPPGADLQGLVSNHLMRLHLNDGVVSDEEKAALKLSGTSKEDERK